MADSEQTGDSQPTVAELQKQLKAATDNYEKLTRAHEKLKEDHTTLKATSSDAAELQKQIEKHITDKSKLMREKEELAQGLEGFKKEVQQKELKQHLTTALEEAGAFNAATPMKLIDMAAIQFDENGNVVQQSVVDAVLAIKANDPYLFKADGEEVPNGQTATSASTTGTSQAVSVKAAVNNISKSAFQTEMEAAVATKDPAAVEAVAMKYLKA